MNNLKTLSQLKRDMQKGVKLEMIFNVSKPITDETRIREITATQSNGFKLGKSFFEIPKASLVEYDGKNIKIYACGERELTKDEQNILDNRPSHRKENAEQCRIDMITDGSNMFWKDKQYLTENKADWYWGWSCGKYYSNGKMKDETIKGQLSREYKITE
jgi:hypothetical protein